MGAPARRGLRLAVPAVFFLESTKPLSFLGSQMLVYYDQYKHYGIMILVGTIFFLWLLIKLVVPLFSLQGRRWLLSSFQHKIQKVINLFFK